MPALPMLQEQQMLKQLRREEEAVAGGQPLQLLRRPPTFAAYCAERSSQQAQEYLLCESVAGTVCDVRRCADAVADCERCRDGTGTCARAQASAVTESPAREIRLEIGSPLRLETRQLRSDRISTAGYEERVDYVLVPDGTTPVAITDDDELNGGLCQTVLVFGGPGSGKTHMMMSLLEQYFGAVVQGLLPGGLILDPKGVLRDDIEALLRRIGRADDLMVLGPSDIATPTNLLDVGDVISRRQLGHLLADIVVSAFSDVGDWDSFLYEVLETAVEILYVLDGEITLKSLVDGVTTVTRTAGADGRPTLRPQFVERAEAFLAARGPHADAALRDEDFCEAVRRIDLLIETSESRQIRYVIQLIRIALGAAAGRSWSALSAGKSGGGSAGLLERPFSQGAIVLVSIGEGDPLVRRCVSTIAKALFEIIAASRFTRDREGRGWRERSVCLTCDEFAQVLTEREADGLSDSDFFSRSRQYRCFNLLALQSVHMGLSRVKNASLWSAVVGNANVRIFMSVNDAETAELGAATAGRRPILAPVESWSDSQSGRTYSQGSSLFERSNVPEIVLLQGLARGEGVAVGRLDGRHPEVRFFRVGPHRARHESAQARPRRRGVADAAVPQSDVGPERTS